MQYRSILVLAKRQFLKTRLHNKQNFLTANLDNLFSFIHNSNDTIYFLLKIGTLMNSVSERQKKWKVKNKDFTV